MEEDNNNFPTCIFFNFLGSSIFLEEDETSIFIPVFLEEEVFFKRRSRKRRGFF